MTAIAQSRLRAPKVKAVARARVDSLLEQAWNHRVTLLLAPAGSGKTTALAEFARRTPQQVAWMTCTGTDNSAEGFITHVNAAFHDVTPAIGLGWRTVDDAVEGLTNTTVPVAIAVDDAHTLAASAAETALRGLIDDAPDHVRFVLAGRRAPSFDLGGIRLMGQLLVVDSDQLRFRTWEAEQLFRDLYDTWLRPDDIARLAQRVEGWAAGLQMFHLAARGLSPPEQRRLIDRLNGRARIVREYLVANVLEPISDELRTFLIDTCVLGLVTPTLADQLRQQSGAASHLRELASSQLFTVAIDDDTYRYHEVLRTQLEMLLIERDGEDRTAERYRAAGLLLERDHYLYDALRCFARAGDWPSVRRLADHAADKASATDLGSGESQTRPTAWIGDVPASIVADDPWLLLARARAERLDGHWDASLRSIQAADQKGIGTDFADQCRGERNELTVWLEPVVPGPPNWASQTRSGCRRDPLAAASVLDSEGSGGRVAAAALRLLGGDLDGAQQAAEQAVNDEALGPYGVSAGLTTLAIARLLSRAPGGEWALDQADVHAERAGFGWIARIVRAALALTDRPRGVDEAVRTRDQCARDGDPWGSALSALLGGLGAARRREPAADLLSYAARGFAALDATALEGFCVIAAEIDRDLAVPDAPAAARPAGVMPVVTILADFIGPRTTGRPSGATPRTVEPHDATPNLAVRCLGSFGVASGGLEVSLNELRPRARMLLKMLAIHAPNSVHRESIVDALWPDGDTAAGIHNLQVAASAIRKTLSAAGVHDQLGVQRLGEAYRLVLASECASDLSMFVSHANAAKAAAARGDTDTAYHSAQAALSLHQGQLLAEEGPLEWIVSERSLVSATYETMVVIAASWQIEAGQHREAVELCETAIVLRPYADELWRLLVHANRQRGDLAAASQAQLRYDSVLAEIGA